MKEMENTSLSSDSHLEKEPQMPSSTNLNIKGIEEPYIYISNRKHQEHLSRQTSGSNLGQSTKPVKFPLSQQSSSSSRGASPHMNQAPYLTSGSVRPPVAVKTARSTTPVKSASILRTASPVRTALPVRTASPVRTALPARTASPVRTTSTLSTPLKTQLKSGSIPLISREHENLRMKEKDKKNTPKKELSTFYY